MVKETTKGDLEEADKTFTSLQSEHIRSPLLPEAMLIMAEAHISNEQYVLANYYLDEFIKRYGDKKSVEFAKYQKVKANFLAFKKAFRDQQLILETLKDSKAYIAEYPNSIYRPYVETIVLKLTLAEKEMNEYIAANYYCNGKQKIKPNKNRINSLRNKIPKATKKKPQVLLLPKGCRIVAESPVKPCAQPCARLAANSRN